MFQTKIFLMINFYFLNVFRSPSSTLILTIIADNLPLTLSVLIYYILSEI